MVHKHHLKKKKKKKKKKKFPPHRCLFCQDILTHTPPLTPQPITYPSAPPSPRGDVPTEQGTAGAVLQCQLSVT